MAFIHQFLVIFAAVVIVSHSANVPVNQANQAVGNPWIPPGVAANNPWIPQWVSCTGVGPSCQDCATRIICTKVGGLVKPCDDPTLPHCNLGQCSATPSADCVAQPH